MNGNYEILAKLSAMDNYSHGQLNELRKDIMEMWHSLGVRLEKIERILTDDRQHLAIDALTRSIQGLSGNAEALLKLTIEREARKQLEEPGSQWSPALQDALKINQSKASELDAREVKRGPVTDEEVIGAMRSVGWNLESVEDAKMHYGSTLREYMALLKHFAKSRGLTD